jgi:hypothetical protein
LDREGPPRPLRKEREGGKERGENYKSSPHQCPDFSIPEHLSLFPPFLILHPFIPSPLSLCLNYLDFWLFLLPFFLLLL